MQRVSLGDLSAAARALLALPASARRAAMEQMLSDAARAEAHRRRTGQTAPCGGNGTLMAAALARPHLPPQAPGTAAYLECLHLALSVILTAK